MAEVRAYILSVTAAGLLCALAGSLAGGKGTISVVLRLLTGIVMACVIVQPFGAALTGSLASYIRDLDVQTAAVVAQGTQTAREDLSSRINAETQAYILDMAAQIQAEVSVEVLLDQGTLPVPVGVILSGELSPYARHFLSEEIERELGIPKEAQHWK